MEPATIAAIATPGGRGGIGIIKISGSAAVAIAGKLFKPAGHGQSGDLRAASPITGIAPDTFQSRRLYYGHIVDPDGGRIVDEVLLSVMRAPRSYTREDVVEINSHGGWQAVRRILELVLAEGARLAEPGEFTRRAFLNGRIDLTQAEAVIDLISARTDAALHMAAAQMSGRLKQAVQEMRQHLIDQLTRIEAAIDFPDEVSESVNPQAAAETMRSRVVEPLQILVRQYAEGHFIRDGLKVAIVGRPNVGKSSLLNCLVQKERAIVTSVPGTTRDTIEETVNLQGVPVVLVDCAGLHAARDPIERMGVRKTVEAVEDADLVMLVVEAQQPLSAEDEAIFHRIRQKPGILVLNKIDRVRQKPLVEIPARWYPESRVKTSALYGRGIGKLRETIVARAFGKTALEVADALIPNLRQKKLLEEALEAALAVIREFEGQAAVELIAIHLQEAIDCLGQVLGISLKVDVLEQIFSRFCIGK